MKLGLNLPSKGPWIKAKWVDLVIILSYALVWNREQVFASFFFYSCLVATTMIDSPFIMLMLLSSLLLIPLPLTIV